MHFNFLPLKDRFEAKYIPEPNSGCWLWDGCFVDCDQNGKNLRGVLRHNGKMKYAYRVSYELFVGPIKKGAHILHKCDVPLCVNPSHLYEGSHAQNVMDRKDRNRSAKGQKNGNSKLTEAQIEAIRSDARYQTEIAKDYGIHQSTVSAIKNGYTWKGSTFSGQNGGPDGR